MRRAKQSKEEKAAKDICQVNRWRGRAIETERIKRRGAEDVLKQNQW